MASRVGPDRCRAGLGLCRVVQTRADVESSRPGPMSSRAVPGHVDPSRLGPMSSRPGPS